MPYDHLVNDQLLSEVNETRNAEKETPSGPVIAGKEEDLALK